VRYVEVETAAQLEAACRAAFPECDVLLMAAAVADFRPADPAGHKLKKDGRDALLVAMERTSDVLSALAAERRPGQVLVGFAAETGEAALEHARGKLARKGLDAVVVNDVAVPGIGFDAPENEVAVVTAGGEEHVPRGAKADVARVILSCVDRLRADLGTRTP
jgi:phosphopantothenoylcysteine decarboxylase/phosphopantothenate--cysteine ligase